MMTRQKLERKLRQLRQHVFDGTGAQQDNTQAEIQAVKKQLAPFWKAEHDTPDEFGLTRADKAAMRRHNICPADIM